MQLLFTTRQFVDFALSTGPSKLAVAAASTRERPPPDLYGPMRDVLQDTHRGHRDVAHLADGLDALGPTEQRVYPKLIAGYRRFLRDAGSLAWFEPPLRDYPLGPVTVRVAPELGLLVADKPHVIQVYWSGEPLSPLRAQLLNELHHRALGTTWPGVTFAVLDVRRGKLLPHRRPSPSLGTLLRAEAACLHAIVSEPLTGR